MLLHTKGNLIDLAENGEFDVIVHGCNCFNTMGGGIAREIRERYPDAARMDSRTGRGDINKLGTYTSLLVDMPSNHFFTIINAYTQYNMSTGEDVFEYDAFALIIRKLLHTYRGVRIGLPYIGMGLAGGDKELILSYIEWFAEEQAKSDGSVTLVEYSK
jgi:O-acetyl-ADP-ribose deacetylase (regulator of RNase III)